MSTDWTTGKNKSFGKNEVILKKCQILEKLNINSRNTLYNLHKIYNELDYKYSNEKSFKLFDRYDKLDNSYLENDFENLIILNSAYSIIKSNNNKLFEKSNDEQSINERKTLLYQQLNNDYFSKKLCEKFELSTFFPHLDTLNNIESIEQVPLAFEDDRAKNRPEYGQKLIPCYELGYETFYALISYTDSCGQNELVPVPDLDELTLFRNTLEHPNAENANYKWKIYDEDNNLLYKPSLTDKYLEVASPSSSLLENVDIELQYSEG